MKHSRDRILTTHTGSLPRPLDLFEMLKERASGQPSTPAFEARLQSAVNDVVARQREAGIDIPSDGEQSKISYATYIRHRLTGFEGDSSRPTPQEARAGL